MVSYNNSISFIDLVLVLDNWLESATVSRMQDDLAFLLLRFFGIRWGAPRLEEWWRITRISHCIDVSAWRSMIKNGDTVEVVTDWISCRAMVMASDGL